MAAEARKRKPSRYRDIAARLQRDIRLGRYDIGKLLPTETELMAQHSASRQTVREALRILNDQGLIVRRAGLGSVVIAAEPPVLFTHSVTSLAEWLRYSNETYRDVVAAPRHRRRPQARRPAEMRARQALVPDRGGADGPTSSRRRSAGPRSTCCANSPTSSNAPTMAARRCTSRSPRCTGRSPSMPRWRFSRAACRGSWRRRLQVKPGSPALTVVRRYYGAHEELFEVTVTTHPEGRYTYSMDMQRSLRPRV